MQVDIMLGHGWLGVGFLLVLIYIGLSKVRGTLLGNY